MTVEAGRTTDGRRIAAAAVVAAGSYATTLIGRAALSVFAMALLVLAYLELRRTLIRGGSRLSLALGGAAVGVLAWIGTQGRPQDLLWVLVGLVLALLAGRVFLAELGTRPPDGATADVGATVAAAGIVGVLGTHLLLVRAVPRYGVSGVLVFLSIAAAAAAGGAIGDRFGRRPVPDPERSRTWEGVVAQALAATAAGVVGGAIADPPFGVVSGLVLGALAGVLSIVGSFAGAALTRGAQPTALFGLASGPLLAAPAFYWAFRTLVL